MALALTESLRLQSVDALANLRTRRIVVGFLPRNPATLVTNSWRLARNQQTTRVRCGEAIPDAVVIALATHCRSLTSIRLGYCYNITDAAVIALATHCPNLTKVDLRYCRDVTDEAVTTLRESHPGIHLLKKNKAAT